MKKLIEEIDGILEHLNNLKQEAKLSKDQLWGIDYCINLIKTLPHTKEKYEKIL